jgi:hypothetical protein
MLSSDSDVEEVHERVHYNTTSNVEEVYERIHYNEDTSEVFLSKDLTFYYLHEDLPNSS